MKYESKRFLFGADEPIEQLTDGISRQMHGYNDNIMMARVFFDAGAVGYVHEHVHSQITYVESGEFEVQVGDETHLLKAGDSVYIPPNVLHGSVCKDTGVLLDIFSPVREDFLTGE